METKNGILKGEYPELLYKIHLPIENIDRPGLIVLLHGVGSNENDLFRLANQFPKGFVVVSARAPYTLAEGRYAWFELSYAENKPVINAGQAEHSRMVINAFVNQLVDKYGIDKKKVFLGGFSQGGIMSYSVGLTFPQQFKGIFILSSRLLPEVKPLIQSTRALNQLKVFIAHGRQDNVLSPSYAREARAYLHDRILEVTYHEYDMGHTISEQELADLLLWLA